MIKSCQVAQMRAFLEKIYNETGKKEDLNSLTDEEIMRLAENLQNGVPFATPVFDGASEEQIGKMLDLAFPEDVAKRLQLTPSKTQCTLYDGRTGEAFDRPVTVGYMHYLKLHHWLMTRCTLVPRVRIRWLRSNRWVVRLNSVVNASVKWKCGLWKLTVPLTCCKKC